MQYNNKLKLSDDSAKDKSKKRLHDCRFICEDYRNSKALQKYFDNIWNEYGSNGVKKAIKAPKLHIEYRREFGHPVDSIEEICAKAESRL